MKIMVNFVEYIVNSIQVENYGQLM